jgi:serine O-acetyltransferase
MTAESLKFYMEQRAASKGPLRDGDRNDNPSGIGLLALIAEDFRTHGKDPLAAGFWALAVHRIGNWRMGIRTRAVRKPLTLAYELARQVVIAAWGMDLPYNSRIGRRVRFNHHGCVFVGAWNIGDDVVFHHSATIGLVRRGSSKAPIIGSRVEIGPGACIVGEIEVGDDCYVGPNTVLAQSVAAGTTLLGVPARTVSLERLIDPVPQAPPPQAPAPAAREADGAECDTAPKC